MWRTIGAAAVISATVMAGTANAQSGIAQVVGGVTKTANQNPVFGGQFGFKVGPIEIDAEGGRMMNIVPKTTYNIARTLSGGTIEAKLPANYGLASIRLIAAAGPVQPFIQGGVGFAHLEPQLTSTNNSTTIALVFGNNSGDQDKFLAAGGGGLRFSTGHLAVDAGYRYTRIFQKYRNDTNFNNDDVLVNVHMFYAALGVRF